MARRGVSLGVTLLVIALLVTLMFTLASLSVSQMTMFTGLSARQEAENAARSALDLAIERVQADTAFGSSATNNTLTVRTPAGAEGFLTFQTDLGRPWSTNNLLGTAPVGGWDNESVAPGGVRLVAEGRARGAVQRVEAVIRVPALPALAAGGLVKTEQGVRIAAVQTHAEVGPLLAQDASVVPRPADLVANADVSLGPGTDIEGDVQSAGKIDLAPEPGCQVRGELRSGAPPVNLPTLDVTGLDPAGPLCTVVNSVPAEPTLSGRVRCPSGLTVAGNLTLDSCLLYVVGDLVVHGGVQGKGAIVVTGTTTLENGCSLDAGHRLALLSRGGVTLAGTSPAGSFFQGLVYTEGALRATRLTVLGSVLARGTGPVELVESNIVSLPAHDRLELAGDVVPMTLLSEDSRKSLTLTFEPGPPLRISLRNPEGIARGVASKSLILDPADPTSVKDFFTALCLAWDVRPDPMGSVYRASISIPGRPEEFVLRLWGQSLANRIAEHVSPASPNAPVRFTYDPSKIWRWEDRVRVALWRKRN